MNAGVSFSVMIDKVTFSVLYTTEFAEHYHGLRNRPALMDVISEEKIAEKITEAIPEIADIAAYADEATGVISSASLKMNFVFGLRKTPRGFIVAMVTIMRKQKFIATSIRDYRIDVNPTKVITVQFRRGLSRILQQHVMDDLSAHTHELEDGAGYHLGSGLGDYWVERDGDTYYIDDANWTHDTYEIAVA